MIPKVFPSFTGSFKCFFVAYAVITCREIGGLANRIKFFHLRTYRRWKCAYLISHKWVELKIISKTNIFHPMCCSTTSFHWPETILSQDIGHEEVSKFQVASTVWVNQMVRSPCALYDPWLFKSDEEWSTMNKKCIPVLIRVNLLALLLIQIRWNLNLRMGLSIVVCSPWCEAWIPNLILWIHCR